MVVAILPLALRHRPRLAALGARPVTAVPRASGQVRVGIVGLGYWGSNVARILGLIDDCEVVWCCDADPGREEASRAANPGTRFTADLDELLADESLEAIAVATPVPTHGDDRARGCSKRARHCFVEKPLANELGDGRATRRPCRRAGRGC